MSSAESERGTPAPVQAVHRTVRALEQLADHPEGVSVLQLADALQVEKSIASRVLATLLGDNWVIREPGDDRYRLSLRMIALATRYSDNVGFPTLCQPILQDLAHRTGELVQLSAVDGDHLVLTAYAQPRGSGLTIKPDLGNDVSPHATASGQAWLSTLPSDEAIATAVRLGLRKLTDHTITKVTALAHALEQTRERGYAFVDGHFLDYVNAAAVPIGAPRFGSTVGTLAISAPAQRLPAVTTQIFDEMRRAADELTDIWPTQLAQLSGAVLAP